MPVSDGPALPCRAKAAQATCHPARSPASPQHPDTACTLFGRYCANFTLTQLQPMFKSKLINFVHLDIIPYGNARTDPNTGAARSRSSSLYALLQHIHAHALRERVCQPPHNSHNGFCVLPAGAVTCQHGAVECQLNKLLSCSIALNPVVVRSVRCHLTPCFRASPSTPADVPCRTKPAHVPWNPTPFVV